MGACHLQAGALALDEEVFSGRLRQRASELEALANERIDAGRSNLATVIANVTPAEIVGEEDHEVRLEQGCFLANIPVMMAPSSVAG